MEDYICTYGNGCRAYCDDGRCKNVDEMCEYRKPKHPFAIACRKCGSNNIDVFAHDNHDLSIRCKDCGLYINCGSYHTREYDYSNCTNW